MIVIPCYEVNTYSLAFKAKNVDLMMEVLKGMGLSPRYSKEYKEITTDIGTFDLVSGEVEVTSRNRSKINSFRKMYSEKVIETAAKKFKWNVKRKKVGNKTTYNAVKW